MYFLKKIFLLSILCLLSCNNETPRRSFYHYWDVVCPNSNSRTVKLKDVLPLDWDTLYISWYDDSLNSILLHRPCQLDGYDDQLKWIFMRKGEIVYTYLQPVWIIEGVNRNMVSFGVTGFRFMCLIFTPENAIFEVERIPNLGDGDRDNIGVGYDRMRNIDNPIYFYRGDPIPENLARTDTLTRQ